MMKSKPPATGYAACTVGTPSAQYNWAPTTVSVSGSAWGFSTMPQVNQVDELSRLLDNLAYAAKNRSPREFARLVFDVHEASDEMYLLCMDPE